MQVKSKVAHIEPGTLAYREEGEVFDRDGALYKHVEVVEPDPEPKGKELLKGKGKKVEPEE